jgi:predicted transposase YbfD/YdcC
MWGKANIDWLRKFLSYKNKIPTAKTVRNVISHLDPDHFKGSFERWVASMSSELSGVVAIDGKTVRGSKKNKDGSGAAHLVTAFSHKLGLVLGQEKVEEKSNEITAIPELLERLALAGTIVTIDAMGAQKNIADKIRDAEADYVLALKNNQGTLYKDVTLFFDEKSKMVLWDVADHTDAGHGRIEIRSSTVTSDIEWLKERHPEWRDLKSIVKIESTRIQKKTGEETRDTRYYISSLPAKAKHLLDCTRAHWAIENTLHWSLDVTFREDSARTRVDYGAENMAIIRRSAFNILKKDDEKLPLKRRRLKALLESDYREKLLAS